LFGCTEAEGWVQAKGINYATETNPLRITVIRGEEVEVEVERNVDGTSSVYYKVKEDGEYGMNLFYGGQPLPNGQYTFQVRIIT